jgi:hypothetical protein
MVLSDVTSGFSPPDTALDIIPGSDEQQTILYYSLPSSLYVCNILLVKNGGGKEKEILIYKRNR